MPYYETFLDGVLEPELWPSFRVRRKVHDDVLARLDTFQGLQQSREAVSHETQSVRGEDDDRYLQTLEILLVVHLLVRRNERVKQRVSVTQELTVFQARPIKVRDSRDVVRRRQHFLQLTRDALVDEDAHP